MKRWDWSGGPGGHGSMHHRRVGSIGMQVLIHARTLKGRTYARPNGWQSK